MSFLECAFGRDTVNLLRLVGDVKAFGLDDIVMLGEQRALTVMKFPGNLYDPGPIVEIRKGRSFIVRNAGRFRVENQIHRRTEEWLMGKFSVAWWKGQVGSTRGANPEGEVFAVADGSKQMTVNILSKTILPLEFNKNKS